MKYLILCCFILFCISSVITADPVIVAGGTDNDYESWLQRIDDGRIMLVFCKNPDFSAGDLYVTFSSNDGQSWDNPILIIGGSSDQTLLSFAQMPDSNFQMYYSSNETGSYGVHWATSGDGVTWTPQGKLNLGWSSYNTVYDPNIYLCQDGTLIMIYVVYGQGIYITKTDEYGIWDKQHRQIDTSSYRPRIIQTNDGKYALAYHKRNGPSQYDYDVFVRHSSDFETWSDPQQISTNNNSHDAFIAQDENGNFYVYYAKYTGGRYKLRRKTSPDFMNWSEEEIITNPVLNDTQPHLFIEDDNIYMSWAHEVVSGVDHDVYFEKFENAVVSINQEQPSQQENISCFPNPVYKRNDKISISYSIDKPSEVNIQLFNLKGQLITTLVDEYKNRGNHKTSMSPRILSSGIYFMKLSIEGIDKEIKKLVIFN